MNNGTWIDRKPRFSDGVDNLSDVFTLSNFRPCPRRVLEEAPQQVALRTLAAGRPFAIVASTLEIQFEAVRAGMGIAMLPEFMVEPGHDLAYVDGEPPAPSRDVWLAIHANLRTPHRSGPSPRR